jgi:hypothetical protein
MPTEKPKTGLWRRWRDKQRAKRERRGPSAEAQHEERNADKVFDSTAVARNAERRFPPPVTEGFRTPR